MKATLTVLAILISCCSFSQDLDSIRTKLKEITEKNAMLRGQVMLTIKNYGYESSEMRELNREITVFDSVSLIYVVGILEEYGWLGKSEIGEVAGNALFIVIQHASNDMRKRFFPLLKKSVEEGESHPQNMAAMKDRILLHDGKKQLYGTQYRIDNGVKKLQPIEDPTNLNKRRKEIGLKRLKDF